MLLSLNLGKLKPKNNHEQKLLLANSASGREERKQVLRTGLGFPSPKLQRNQHDQNMVQLFLFSQSGEVNGHRLEYLELY